MKIHRKARKHGIADADIEHVMKNAMAFEHQDDGRLLYLGHSRSGMPLEVVKVVGSELVIHAMKTTRNHERLLLGYRALR
jgi:nickel-dependent lactate racemase